MTRPSRPDHVYSVHTTKPSDVGAIEIVFDSERAARTYATERSRDHHVLSTSVTRFTVNQLGSRHPVTWYIDGVEQRQWFDRPLYPRDEPNHGPTTARRDQPRGDTQLHGTSPCVSS